MTAAGRAPRFREAAPHRRPRRGRLRVDAPLVVGQLREVAVEAPLYVGLHRHAQLRQTLTLLRANLAEIRTLRTTARHTTDPDELRTLAAAAAELQQQVQDQLQRELPATGDPAVHRRPRGRRVAWDDFATTSAAASR